ncbi:MAG: site-specific integrase [Ferruginibacter sp.]
MNTSIKVLLYSSKTLSNGEHPIMLRVIKDRKPKYISVGFSCTTDLWDDGENLPKKKHPHFKEIKILIAKKKLDAERLVLNLENDDKNLSSHEIKGKLRKQKMNNPLVMDYFNCIVERFVQSGQIKNSEVYKDTKRNLFHFINTRKLHFSDIDVLFLNSFEEFLKKSGKGENTIYIYLRTLRALINKAIKEDICSEKYYAFKNFSLTKYSKIKTEKRAIEKDDIEKIKKLNLKNNKELIDAKNIFLFSFYCRGINFIDIASLKWKDTKGERLSYRRSKTNELFNLSLLKPAQDILDYYHPLTYASKESYIFPIFNQNHNTPQALYNRKVKMLRKINADLKEIAALTKLKTELTTYVARHSYATILKKSGISTSIISEAMGHDSEKTTQIYLESFGNNILDEASKAIL